MHKICDIGTKDTRKKQNKMKNKKLFGRDIVVVVVVFALDFFRAVRFDEHFQLLRDDTFILDFMLCYAT